MEGNEERIRISFSLKFFVVQQEWSILSENLTNEAQVINEVNNSEATEQDNTENSRNNEDPGASVVRQESIDEASTSSVASSPRSVLPEKTIADEVLSPVYNQHIHIGAQQSNIEDMAQETLNDEHSPDTMAQNIQPLMEDTTDESHNGDFNHSQVFILGANVYFFFFLIYIINLINH